MKYKWGGIRMKKIATILALILLLVGFTFKTSKYTNLSSYVCNLVEASNITIKYIKAPNVKNYFGDVKSKDKFAKPMIYAADSGILEFPKKKVYPYNKITVSYAKVLMDRAYNYVTKNDEDISKKVFDELRKDKKFSKLGDKQYLTVEAEKEVIKIYKQKIDEFMEMSNKNNNEVSVATSKGNGYLEVTLKWGKKPTGGYAVKIVEAVQKDDTIQVKYYTKSPGPKDMVTQAITFPQDTIKVNIDNVNRNFKIELVKVLK